mgnify:CR=1 FL=1
MSVIAQCGSCQKRFKAEEKLAGKNVKCPQCGGVTRMSFPAWPPPPWRSWEFGPPTP